MPDPTLARRVLLTGLGLGAAALASAPAQAQTQSPWRPTLDPKDDWMELPGQHRLVFDALSPKGADEAASFTTNYYLTTKSGYGLEPSDLATIVILRHMATPFGYNDAMWAKYGAIMSRIMKYTDPKTKKPPTSNLLNASDPKAPPGKDASIPALVAKGVHFAICGAATHFLAGEIARKTKADAGDVQKELESNLIPNAHMVPSGITAVNRAQERGYAFSYVG
jgi:intracellular sulfur oxidation DsrE/DsrF family protein